MTFNSLNRHRVLGKLCRCLKHLLPVTLAIVAAAPFPAAANQCSTLMATTANFTVRSYCDGPNATEVAALCETLRQKIQTRWLDKATAETWRPRCEIVLHATRSGYLRAAGNNAGQTSGSSLIQQLDNRVVFRRIDLLVDDHGSATALAHELTHIMLADEFGGQQPPPWLDEGIATLADSEDKVARHQSECDVAVRSGTAFHLIELLALDRLSSSAQFPAFYGQSVSLVTYLCERDEPAKLVPFAQLALEKGYDEALRTSYEINGVGQLQRLWLERVAAARSGHKFRVAAVQLER